MNTRFTLLLLRAAVIGLSLGLSACLQNGTGAKKFAVKATPTPGTTTSPKTTLTPNLATPKPGATPEPVVMLNFPSTDPLKKASLVCNASGSKPCSCRFTWTQANGSVQIAREATTQVIAGQDYSFDCRLPAVYAAEIGDRTPIRLEVTPTGANPAGATYAISPITFQKSSQETGPIHDRDGRGFDVIHRYMCFEQFQRGTQIFTRVDPVSTSMDNKTYEADVASATRFCFFQHNGEIKCEGSPTAGVVAGSDSRRSGHSYSYTFQIQGGQIGSVNPTNNRYACIELLDGNDAAIPNTKKLYPFDAQFILGVSKSEVYSVPVQTLRTPKLNSAEADFGVVGYAAPPKPDGSCPSFRSENKDGSGNYIDVPMQRLRRYVAIYPPQYDTNGLRIAGESPAMDFFYGIDRPAVGPGGAVTAAIEGPKPCPFSFYDEKGVTQSGNAGKYVATNSPLWAGKSVDGLELPYVDRPAGLVSDPISGGTLPASCSAAIAVYDVKKRGTNAEEPIWALATIRRAANDLTRPTAPIAPIEPFSPRYQEDTSFRACAPLAPAPYYKEPPLQHFRTAGGASAWCAKTLPNQIPAYPGSPKTWSNGEVARELQPKITSDCASLDTCASSSKRRRYNLVAPTASISLALEQETSYRCLYTQDGGAGRSGIQSPPSACAANLPNGHSEVKSDGWAPAPW